jgi:hypothetical protein
MKYMKVFFPAHSSKLVTEIAEESFEVLLSLKV